MTDAPHRRSSDLAIAILTDKFDGLEERTDHLHECVEEVKRIGAENRAALAANTALTQEVRDILATFRILGAVAKWATGIGAFGLMLYHGWQKVTGR